MKTLFLAIPYAVAVRDVLRSGTLEILAADPEVRVVVLVPRGSLESLSAEFRRERVAFEPLEPFKASLTERLLYHFNRGLLHEKCRTIQLGNVHGVTWSLRAAVPIARAARALLGERRVVRAMAWCFRHLTPTRLYADLFAKHRPDLVVVSRVLNYSMDYPVMKRAQVEGVPVVVLVSSWDNLTSKGFFAFDAARLVVWNEVMKAEAVDLFHYPPERVAVSGIPRYDVFFRTEGRPSREAFLSGLGLDPSKRLVTYATASATTGLGPQDPVTPEPEICEFLADAIASGRLPGAQLLIRLHPQAKPEQYASLLPRPDVTVQIPGAASTFVDRLFSPDDDRAFADLMRHSDVVVNLVSTVALDAVACDTPVVCVGFDFRGPRPYLESVRRYYDFDHYAKLGATGCYRLAGSREELLDEVARYLGDRSLDGEARRRARDLYCVHTDGTAGRRVGEEVLRTLHALGTEAGHG